MRPAHAHSLRERVRRFYKPGRTALLGLALSVAACSSGGNPTSVDLSSLEVSEFQQQFLADGVVEFAEYEAAITADAECMRAAGYQVDGPVLSAGGRFLNFVVTVDPGRELSAAEEDALIEKLDTDSESCRNRFSDDVAREWTRDSQLSEEEVAAAFEDLLSCLARTGMQLEGVDTLNDLVSMLREMESQTELPSGAAECLDLYGEQTSFVP